jgi:hypothetical protein
MFPFVFFPRFPSLFLVVSLRVCVSACSFFVVCLFKHMKIKYPTRLKMAMYAETCSETVKTNTNKAARRQKHNLQYPLNNTVQQDPRI